MGAGASSIDRPKLENSWVVSEIREPNKNENYLSIPSPLILIITQESLDLTSVDKTQTTVLHYPYHQIKCWSSTASFFSFQLGIESVQTVLKFQTCDGPIIQKHLLNTILRFMTQSKEGALQPLDFKAFRSLLFDSSKNLHANWSDIMANYFQTVPFRLTAAHALDLLDGIDLADEFVSLDFCCMLHKYILNQESFKLVMNSITDKQLKHNLAKRLGIEACFPEGVTVKSPHTPIACNESSRLAT